MRTAAVDTHEPASDWLPLASAPSLDVPRRLRDRLPAAGLGRAEPAPARGAAGRRRSGRAADPAVQRGAVLRRQDRDARRRSSPAGPELQFEGDGAYAVTVSVGPSAGGAAGCLSGPSPRGLVRRRRPRGPGARGLAAELPRHALRARPSSACTPPTRRAARPTSAARWTRRSQPDGSVTGASVAPGPTTATPPDRVRGRLPAAGRLDVRRPRHREGVDEGFEATRLRRRAGRRRWRSTCAATSAAGAGASPARALAARASPSRRSGRPAAAGGRVTVTLFRVTGCNDRAYRLRRVGRLRGPLRRAPRARVAAPRPRKPGYYLGRFAFGGTRFLRASRRPRRRCSSRPPAARSATPADVRPLHRAIPPSSLLAPC